MANDSISPEEQREQEADNAEAAYKAMLRQTKDLPITPEKFAKFILEAARIHEESYKPYDCEALVGGAYTKTIGDAATEVTLAEPHWFMPIYLAAATSWNDILDWANAVVGED